MKFFKSIWAWLEKPFFVFSVFVRYLYLLFPSFLFLLLGIYLFWIIAQGKDVLMIAVLEHKWAFTGVMLSLVFWVFVTWYSGRILVYKMHSLFISSKDAAPDFGNWKWNFIWIWKHGWDYLVHNSAEKFGFHLPRMMGYIIFSVLALGILQMPLYASVSEHFTSFKWLYLLGSVFFYFVFNRIFLRFSRSHIQWIQRIHWTIFFAFIFILFLPVFFNFKVIGYIFWITVMQLMFLFIVVSRRPLLEDKTLKGQFAKQEEKLRNSKKWYDRLIVWFLDVFEIEYGDQWVFIIFNCIGIVALIIYLIGVFNIAFANLLGALPFVMLAFGILVGYFSSVSTLSIMRKLNIHLIIFLLVFILGSSRELHNVRLFKNEHAKDGMAYAARPALKDYFLQWAKVHEADIAKDSAYPLFFVLADGGASRSGYWAASVLGFLQDTTKGKFGEHLFCLSGASGGSVGNGTFFALLAKQKNMLQRSYRDASREYLASDFLTYTMARMLGPDVFRPLAPFGLLDKLDDRAGSLETAMEYGNGKEGVLKNEFANNFSTYIPNFKDSLNQPLPIICINTTRMQDGRPAIISNVQIEEKIFGSRLDVLSFVDSLKESKEIHLSTAVAMGARFPYISPAGRIGKQYFVDGGYFDNSGAGAVHEMILGLQKMIAEKVKEPGFAFLHNIQFHVIHCTNSPAPNNDVEPVHFLLNDLAAPAVTLIGAYGTQTNVNNLRLKRFLQAANASNAQSYWNVDLYFGNDKTKYPMNWTISAFYRKKMDERLSASAQNGQFFDLQDFMRKHGLMK